jgi:hypothetical protein
MPMENRYSTGSKKFGRIFNFHVRLYMTALRRQTASKWGTETLKD